MPNVIVNHDLSIADALEDQSKDLTATSHRNAEETVSALAEAEIFVCSPGRWDDRFLDALGPGDWVQATSAGYAAFPIETFHDRNILFTNATGIHDPVVAEHVFALAFSFSRKIPEFVSKQSAGVWGPRTEVSTELTDWTDCTLTVFGLGSIGEAIARRGLAFGMEVYGVKRDPDVYDGCLSPTRVIADDEFHDVLPETDLLVVVVPLTEETRHVIDTAVFRAIPDNAILVNVARGPVVDQSALVDALQSGQLAGAGLDVFETEPLPGDSPLWNRDDVIVTPHIGGRSDTFPKRFADLFVENYERLQRDQTLLNQIT